MHSVPYYGRREGRVGNYATSGRGRANELRRAYFPTALLPPSVPSLARIELKWVKAFLTRRVNVRQAAGQPPPPFSSDARTHANPCFPTLTRSLARSHLSLSSSPRNETSVPPSASSLHQLLCKQDGVSDNGTVKSRGKSLTLFPMPGLIPLHVVVV